MGNTLYIIRGLPGSGKSTEARQIMEKLENSVKWFEADMYFIDSFGNYNFNASKLSEAHQWCLGNTKKYLQLGLSVIVSNTFSTLWELKPYQSLANKLNVKLDIRQMNNEFQSIHGVPDLTIQKMKKRWQNFPGCVQIPPVII